MGTQHIPAGLQTSEDGPIPALRLCAITRSVDDHPRTPFPWESTGSDYEIALQCDSRLNLEGELYDFARKYASWSSMMLGVGFMLL